MQLCGSLGSFLYSSSVYSCHLFLISFASASPYCFCPLFCPSLHEIFPLISQIFLKRSLVFPFLLSSLLHCSLKKGFLFSPSYSLEICIQMGITFLFASFLFSAIFKASSDNHFAILRLFLLGIVLVTASCSMLQTSARSSSDSLTDLIP